MGESRGIRLLVGIDLAVLSDSEVSASFIDTASTLGKRVTWMIVRKVCDAKPEVLQDKDISDMLIAADEKSGNGIRKGPFSHWSKYQIYIQKGKTPQGIRWLFFATNLTRTLILTLVASLLPGLFQE